MNPLKVLIIEDSIDDAALLIRELQQGGYAPEYERVQTAEAIGKALDEKPWDIILSDYVLPRFDGLSALRVLQSKGVDVPFILVSGAIGEERAVEVMKAGAVDYIMKGNLKRLIPAVQRELREAEIRANKRLAEEALRESEERYRSLFDTSIEMVQSISPDCHFLMVNRAWQDTLGYSETEIASITMFDIIAPECRAHCQELFSVVMNGGSVRNIETTFITKTGKELLVEGNVTPRVVDGRVVATHGVFRNVTEQKKFERALKESEAKYSALVEQSNDGIIIIQDGWVEFMNPRMAVMTGYPAGDAIGKPFIEFVAPADRDAVMDRYRRRLSGEHVPNNYEISIASKDGKTVPVEVNANLIDYKGRLADMAIIRDITERKAAEAALRTSEEKYRNLVENAPVAISLVTLDGRAIERNTVAIEIYGYDSKEDLLKSSAQQRYYNPDDRRRFLELVKKGAVKNFEVRMKKKDGTPFWESLSAIPQMTEYGPGIITIGQDITERKLAEEALRTSEQLYRSLFENMLNGFAYCKMLFEDNKPQDFIYLNVNKAFEKLTGLKNAVGKKVSEVIPGIRESDPQLFEIYGQVALTGVPEQFEIYVKGLDMWFSISVYSPQREYFVAVFDVITERKKAEAALRASEEKFRNLVESAPVGIGITTLDGRPLLRNKAQARMLGYDSVEELFLNPVTARYNSPEDRRRFIAQASVGLVKDFEVLMKRRDGSLIWTSLTAIPQTNERGEKEFITITQDITERKRSEEELKRNYETETILNQLLALSLENIPLNELLQKAFEHLLAASWLGLEAKGAIFIADEKADTLVMTAWIGLIPPVLEKCRRVPFGTCICGRAAADQIIMFCDDIDEHHKIQFPGITPHGHYCIPIIYESRTIGVINTYVKEGHERNEREERFLSDVANVLAGIIARRQAEEAQKYSEAKFRRLVENAPVGISVTRPDGERIDANNAMIEMHGYQSKGEFLAANVAGVYADPDERKSFLHLLAENPVRSYEMQRKRKDGSVFWASISASYFTAASGEKQIINIVEDISIRKGVEQALRDSEARYRSLIESAPAGIGIATVDGRTIQRNRTFMEMLGYDNLVEFNALPLEDIYFDIGDRARFLDLMRSGSVKNLEIRFRRKNSRPLWMMVNSIVQNSPSGEKQFFSVFQDIDDRKKAEAENELKAMLLDSAGDLIIVTDLNGNFVYMNDSACRNHGYTRDEMMGKTIHDLLTPERREYVVHRDEEAIREGGIKFETVHVCKNGTVIELEIFNRPVKIGDETVIISVERDITERKKEQQQLIVTSRLASIGELASGVAHEINNPLTSVIGFSSLLLERPLPDDIKDDLGIVLSEAQRAAHVVRNLLTFARKHVPSREPVDINSVIEKVLEIRAYEQRANNIKTMKNLGTEIPKINADFYQLQQVFFNLVVNAEYFMSEAHKGGILTITTENKTGVIRVKVADDGPGISEETQKHLFNPFYTTKPIGKGTGLGLSICHGIVAEHGGSIRVESTPGKGATFIVELPIEGQNIGEEGARIGQ